MSLKASLFNKSILKSDIKRFWWIALLETLFIFGVSVIPLWENCQRVAEYGASYMMCKPTWASFSIVFLILFVAGVGTGLFTYVHFSSSVSMHHSIPIKRTTMLSTKLLTGVILTIVPVIINAVIFGLTLTEPLYREFYSMGDVFGWLASGVLYTVVLLSLTTVVNMMTGNPVGTIIFATGFAFLPLIVCTFFEYFFYTELYGYTDSVMEVLSKIYIFENRLITFPYYLIYILLTAVFVFGAYMFYKKRKLENHGEVIAFEWLKPVFIAIVSVLSSMASYVYFIGVMNVYNILTVLPLGILGTVIAWMISRKSISLRGVLKPVIWYVVCALAFCAVIHFDLTGFEKRIPDAEDVAEVDILNETGMAHSHVIDNETVVYVEDGGIDTHFISKKDIQNVMALHAHLILQKDSTEPRTNVENITYTLKNGKTIKRQYNVDFKLDKEYLKPIYETPQMKASRFGLVNGREHEYLSVTVNDRRISGGADVVFYPDSVDMQKIIDAVKKDVEELTYEEFVENDGASTIVSVSYKNKYKTDKGTYEFDRICTENDTYAIRNSYKHTKAVLTQIGFYDNLPQDSDIVKAVVETWDAEDEMSAKDIVAKTTAEITDAGEIKTLYSFYDTMIETSNYALYEECKNISITYTLKNGATFIVSCSYGPDKIPQEFAKYFK